MEGHLFSAALSGSFLASCLLFAAVGRALREPYMDEVFHLPQAQRFCQGHFTEWDPMITTLPGLYLLSVGVVKPAGWLLGWPEQVVCSIGALRFVNLLFSAGNFYLLHLLLCRTQPRHKGSLCPVGSRLDSLLNLPPGSSARSEAALPCSRSPAGGAAVLRHQRQLLWVWVILCCWSHPACAITRVRALLGASACVPCTVSHRFQMLP
ncbi:dol-P-Glc:Glc(2)Man(9)GlcNAc(2)-PP-Dol alpha-1,2-glucosyltransferase isoform X8 [Erinaceus europaeus]|uniref:Dol-P-Glc:Glc(2)Man(9)GlcNAc(2)-PP-Dol alpha-1,2-glucosyltransferase n=1 Tax=Erinaceus europaeus TaxID=9365 RepID=A0ABM3XP79_ERIEU|nr:dol-P-Glc:Glc(2)Man(9)GlcNAc(2)-PP-Dol alpha-1,2-glucosyltransferase isoform X8 [Erinaceus europaeus]